MLGDSCRAQAVFRVQAGLYASFEPLGGPSNHLSRLEAVRRSGCLVGGGVRRSGGGTTSPNQFTEESLPASWRLRPGGHGLRAATTHETGRPVSVTPPPTSHQGSSPRASVGGDGSPSPDVATEIGPGDGNRPQVRRRSFPLGRESLRHPADLRTYFLPKSRRREVGGARRPGEEGRRFARQPLRTARSSWRRRSGGERADFYDLSGRNRERHHRKQPSTRSRQDSSRSVHECWSLGRGAARR